MEYLSVSKVVMAINFHTMKCTIDTPGGTMPRDRSNCSPVHVSVITRDKTYGLRMRVAEIAGR